MSFAAFRTKIIAKQEKTRDRRQLAISQSSKGLGLVDVRRDNKLY